MNNTHGITDGLLPNDVATRRVQMHFQPILYPMREHPPYNEIPMDTHDEYLHLLPNITFDQRPHPQPTL